MGDVTVVREDVVENNVIGYRVDLRERTLRRLIRISVSAHVGLRLAADGFAASYEVSVDGGVEKIYLDADGRMFTVCRLHGTRRIPDDLDVENCRVYKSGEDYVL